MMKLLRQNTSSYNLLFEKLPQTFGYDEFTPGMCENIQAAKDCFDGMIDRLKQSSNPQRLRPSLCHIQAIGPMHEHHLHL